MTYLIDEVRERKVIGRTVNYIGGKKASRIGNTYLLDFRR